MKPIIYRFLFIIALLLPTAALHSETITGTSEPFIFGESIAVPLSTLALVLTFLLIGVFFYRSYLSKKKQSA